MVLERSGGESKKQGRKEEGRKEEGRKEEGRKEEGRRKKEEGRRKKGREKGGSLGKCVLFGFFSFFEGGAWNKRQVNPMFFRSLARSCVFGQRRVTRHTKETETK